ncbi:Hypothetical protein PFREUD_21040 [Propionibacterium freudenreichii subsp. shermanii CIRM-BIA1]|uniref:Uncharacterized protein n=1 Tax=Propionibacterium freudenreichii subsp. shermanii (strain ATCC 9614 / DSM 4902 / CIP 103027 / NCIMB 8099 / CIRM-BIA1) TaxID=754252 RepID=D7GGD6_PROFC|nr:Hypothetical protein PFREUD_21040 [Propionibacterium freudenreichii subsp. shermanii CIRM-BIA1]
MASLAGDTEDESLNLTHTEQFRPPRLR